MASSSLSLGLVSTNKRDGQVYVELQEHLDLAPRDSDMSPSSLYFRLTLANEGDGELYFELQQHLDSPYSDSEMTPRALDCTLAPANKRDGHVYVELQRQLDPAGPYAEMIPTFLDCKLTPANKRDGQVYVDLQRHLDPSPPDEQAAAPIVRRAPRRVLRPAVMKLTEEEVRQLEEDSLAALASYCRSDCTKILNLDELGPAIDEAIDVWETDSMKRQ